MATPGRQRPVSPATTSSTTQHAALRAKIATMTYSFAQQMPQLPSPLSTSIPAPPDHALHQHPSPLAEDPNFPLLAPAQRNQPSAHTPTSSPSLSQTVWHHSPSNHSSSVTRSSRWSNPHGKPTTAAEVVASTPPDQSSQQHQDSESAKQEAELALYSKLVPTTSAVPRNPGRSLGGGGLRATGSVVAQPARSTPSPLQTTQKPAIPRKEPMASRMRSLSSETSTPQLARRIARPNRTHPATPPSQLLTTSNSAAALEDTKAEPALEDEHAAELLRDEPSSETPSQLRNIISVFGKVEREPLRPNLQKDSPSPEDLSRNDKPIAPLARAPTPTSRHLEEAFSNGDRFDNTRTPSPIPTRRHQLGALRRGSPVLSPSQVSSLSRNSSGRDLTSSPVRNGARSPAREAAAEIPPGFEGRTAGLTRAGFMARGKGDGSSGSRSAGRDKAPMPPQNSRADAFREAINSRRHSSSTRSGSRRNSHSDRDPTNEGGQVSRATSIQAARNAFEAEHSPKHDGKRGMARPNSLPSRAVTTSDIPSNKAASKAVGDGSKSGSLKHRREGGRFVRQSVNSPNGVTGDSDGEVVQQQNCKSLPTSSNGISSSMKAAVKQHTRGHHESNGILSGEDDQYIGDMGAASGEKVKLIGGCQASSSGEILRSTSQAQTSEANGWSEGRTEGENETRGEIMNELVYDGETKEEGGGVEVGGGNRRMERSMIDRARQWQLDSGSTLSLLSREERNEEVLPPLPNPEEGVRFESMLRSMGWTPLEEDETPRNRMSNVGLVFRQGPARNIAVDMGPKRSGNGRETRGLYYSHFQ